MLIFMPRKSSAINRFCACLAQDPCCLAHCCTGGHNIVNEQDAQAGNIRLPTHSVHSGDVFTALLCVTRERLRTVVFDLLQQLTAWQPRF